MKNSLKTLLAVLTFAATLAMSLHGHAQVDAEITDGKIMATQMGQIQDVKADIDALINKVSERGTGLTGSGLGQLSSAIDAILVEAQSTQDSDKMNDLWMEAMELNKDLTQIKTSLHSR